MTNSHARNLQALARYGDRLQQGNQGSIRQGAAQARNIAGAAAPLAAPILKQAKGHAAAANIAMQGAARAGVTVAKGGQTILGILQAGAATAQAGAQGQLADALAYRARDDARLIADRQNLILQSKLEYQNWRRQQDYLKKQADEDATGKLTGVHQVATLAVDAAVAFRRALLDDPSKSVADLVADFAEGDPSIGQNETFVLQKLAHEIKSSVDPNTGETIGGYGRGEEAADIYRSVLQLYPDYKNTKKLKESIRSGLDAGWSSALVAANAAAEAGGAEPAPGEDPNTGAGVPTGDPGSVGYNYMGQQYDASTVKWVAYDAIPSGYLVVGNARDSQGRIQVAKPRA
jgi:hypothetical protein